MRRKLYERKGKGRNKSNRKERKGEVGKESHEKEIKGRSEWNGN